VKKPVVQVKNVKNCCFKDWNNIIGEIKNKIAKINNKKKVIVIECYQGINFNEISNSFINKLSADFIFKASDAYLSVDEIKNKTFADVTDDRIFGFMTRLNIEDYFDKKKLSDVNNKINSISEGLIIIYGTGASLLAKNYDLLVYADMARWEIQLRMRKNMVSNIGLNNENDSSERKYKIGYFVDWRVCDRLKKKLMKNWDYVLDTNAENQPKLVKGQAILEGLKQAAHKPISLVPYFDQGPWGGQWMKDVCDLDKSKPNFAWCINCIPEENSMILGFDDINVEIPSINLVFNKPTELLGEAVYSRFGDEFPIRFDFLDTFDGGNLSMQVHPLTEYIQENFGLNYTQDESYYILDAKEDASVYLGLKENIDAENMISELRTSAKEGSKFNDKKFVNNWPAKKHDHFLIPAGTVHCSGKNSLVLEISSTPYIFTFKLWDWGRLGLDGKPRPINIERGKDVIKWDRTTSWTKKNLINQIQLIGQGDGWKEEKTGLYKSEFIETRRHWFTKKVLHNTNQGVNVLNLIEGREAIVESPSNAFEPFVVHYAETFIVPAAVGEYTIKPYGESKGCQCATIKAFVRTNA